MLKAVLYHLNQYYSTDGLDSYFQTAAIVSVSQSMLWLTLFTSIGDYLINEGNLWLIPYLSQWLVLFIGLNIFYLIYCYILRWKVRDAFEYYSDYKYAKRPYKTGVFAYVILSGLSFVIYAFFLLYIQSQGSTYYSILF